MRHRAGERVEVVVTYLEMDGAPRLPAAAPARPGPASALIGAERPPVWYFLDLYDARRPRLRVDRPARASRRRGRRLPARPGGRRSTPSCAPAGRTASSCSTAARRALRPRLLRPGAGGDRPRPRHLPAADRGAHGLGPARAPAGVTVNTNSLDHPRALPLYQKAGFVPVRRETRRAGADAATATSSTPDRRGPRCSRR